MGNSQLDNKIKTLGYCSVANTGNPNNSALFVILQAFLTMTSKCRIDGANFSCKSQIMTTQLSATICPNFLALIMTVVKICTSQLQ